MDIASKMTVNWDIQFALGHLIVVSALFLMCACMQVAAQEISSFDHQLPADETIQIVRISLQEQTLVVLSGQKIVAVTQVTTGSPEAPTPTGAFQILKKFEEYYSTVYAGVAMPHTMMITSDGIALHGGELTEEPSSGGCIRLPLDFAEWLFEKVSEHTIIEIRRQFSHDVDHFLKALE